MKFIVTFLFATVLLSADALACSPPRTPDPYAIPRMGAQSVSTATSIVVVAGARPSWVTVSADGVDVPIDGVELIGRSPSGVSGYWVVRGIEILEPNKEYVVKAGPSGAETELTRFRTGAGYDKKVGQLPTIASLQLWRTHFPPSEIASGNCVFREYHAAIKIDYSAAALPDTPEADVLYILRLRPETGGLTQTVVFTGDALFKGEATALSPAKSAWPQELDPTRSYCATLEVWGYGHLARAPMSTDPKCAVVEGDVGEALGDSGGCAVIGSVTQLPSVGISGFVFFLVVLMSRHTRHHRSKRNARIRRHPATRRPTNR